jgi:hypothetical protein
VGLTVCLEDENGNRIGLVEDPGNLLHHVLPSPDDPTFRLLSYVDWYGNTVFNQLQVPTVLQELEDSGRGHGPPKSRHCLLASSHSPVNA